MIKNRTDTNDNMKGNKLIESLSTISNCGVTGFDESGNVIFLENEDLCSHCAVKKFPNITNINQKIGGCKKIHCHAGEQSVIFGGKYIYCCPMGFVFVACAVSSAAKDGVRYIVAGPVSPVERSDFDIGEMVRSCGIDENGNRDRDKDRDVSDSLSELIEKIPFLNPEQITSLAVLLQFCAENLSERGNSAQQFTENSKNNEIYEQQREISDYIQNIKAKLMRENQSYISYPYDKEKQLIYAIATNDLANSRKYLNEILGHIFFSSANDLETIKVRAMELSVMISRAALDTGADQSKIFDINVKFLSEFFNYNTIEEVCWALTDILRKFTKETFEFNNVKNLDLISRAVSYIKSNYMKKITLSEVAAYVFLSPSYFSKIFKQEMKYYFNDYLNYVRIQKSKVLLLTEHISLVDIADQVGFYDQSYFNKVFKKITGVTPKKFKESNGKIVPGDSQ